MGYGVKDRDEAVKRFLEDRYLPLGIGQPEDVANAVVFLASPLAKFITGASLDIGGTLRGLDLRKSEWITRLRTQRQNCHRNGSLTRHRKALALGLAQAGARLVLAKYPGPRNEEIAAVKAEIEALGRNALIVQSTYRTWRRFGP